MKKIILLVLAGILFNSYLFAQQQNHSMDNNNFDDATYFINIIKKIIEGKMVDSVLKLFKGNFSVKNHPAGWQYYELIDVAPFQRIDVSVNTSTPKYYSQVYLLLDNKIFINRDNIVKGLNYLEIKSVCSNPDNFRDYNEQVKINNTSYVLFSIERKTNNIKSIIIRSFYKE